MTILIGPTDDELRLRIEALEEAQFPKVNWTGRGRDEMVDELIARGAEEDRAIARAKDSVRRARKLRSAGSFTADEWAALVLKYEKKCGYCGSQPTSLSADHRVPLARGGSNLIENIIPACRSCNLRKYTRTEAEFRATLPAGLPAAPEKDGEHESAHLSKSTGGASDA